MICRISQTERIIEVQTPQGESVQANLAQAGTDANHDGSAKGSTSPSQTAACPVRLADSTAVRRPGKGQSVPKTLWLMHVSVRGTKQDPWLLLTDWQVPDERRAGRIFTIDRERWAAEDRFNVTKQCVGRDLHLWHWPGSRLAFCPTCPFQWEEMQLPAKPGGWEPYNDRLPGHMTLPRGVRRLIDSEHQGRPSRLLMEF